MTSTQDTQNLIERHQRRLQKLKERRATQGINTPPEVLTEIEDIEADLEKLSADLVAEQGQLQQTLQGAMGLASPVAAQIRPPIEQRLAEIERLLQHLAATPTTIFDQRGQQVTTQYNVAGDLIQPAAAEPGPTPEALLHDYLYHLFEDCRQLPLSQLDKNVDSQLEAVFNLSGVYTALLTTSRADEARAPTGREEKQQSALALLNHKPHLVLLGDPGSGKTTFVNFVAMCLAGERLGRAEANLSHLTAPLPDENGENQADNQPWQRGPLLPIRVILRDFAARGLPQTPAETATARHLWKFIEAELQTASLEKFAPHLHKILREQPCLLLLDGLDEVPEAHHRREQLKQAVTGFRGSYSHCRILVTSRGYAYQDPAWKLTRFAEGTLAPFSRGQIIRFVDRWYAHVAVTQRGLLPEAAQTRAALLRQTIFSRPRLHTLAERPLLLAQMAQLHSYGQGSLPNRRERLYAAMVDLLLDKWERPKLFRTASGRLEPEQPALTQWLGVEQERVLKFLEKLAFEIHRDQPEQTGTADIPEKELVYGLLRLSPQRGELNPDDLIDYLSQRAGLLLPRGGDEPVYTFPHRTFQEYLAARYLSDYKYPAEVARLARTSPDRWREVVLLAGAKAGEGSQTNVWGLARKLCWTDCQAAQATPEQWWGALLAGQVLLESANLEEVDDDERETWDRVRLWLRTLVERGELPSVDRALAGNALAELGDDRDFDTLVEISAGSFLMGDDEDRDSSPQHEISLPAFKMGKYPVTNGQFAAFMAAGGYQEQHWWLPDGWQERKKRNWTAPDYWQDSRFNGANRPVVGVSWYEALAYCAWLSEQWRVEGKIPPDEAVRLPSEAEWEKAARSSDGRHYPWGAEWDKLKANTSEGQIGETSPVGMYPAGVSPTGCLDMAGNVWEWTTSLWGEDVMKPTFKYPYDPADGRENLEARTNVHRVVRGGSWFFDRLSARCAIRFGDVPNLRFNARGFRVVVAPISASAL